MNIPPKKLAYPITCETEDIDGNWQLVDLLEYLGGDNQGKWLALDEDGNECIVLSSTLRNPRI